MTPPAVPEVGAIDGAATLDRVSDFLGRFVAYPSEHAHVAQTLWIAHTHLMDEWESTPRIAFLSPEPGSGKTRALEITALLVPLAVEAVNVTPAYLFRKVADPEGRPTILYDEIDTVFGPKAKDNEEIRGLLNAGHRIGAVAGRAVARGRSVETEEIPAYCAVAMAGLGGLPDTILSRSVVIRMQRRRPGERVEPYRRRLHVAEGHDIRDQLVAWAESVAVEWPAMPEGIEDRDADVWEPLLAVAEAASEEWLHRAQVAAVALVAEAQDSTPSLGIKLLTDIRSVFGSDQSRTSTQSLLTSLHNLEEAPWASLRGEPLDARGLARLLKQYEIESTALKIDGTTLRGYTSSSFHDAWERYAPPSLAQNSATSATSATQTRLVAEVAPVADVPEEDARWVS